MSSRSSKSKKKKPIKHFDAIGGYHGVSAIFPKFQDVLDYEEKKINVNQGYPRFVTHPLIRNLEDKYRREYNATASLCCHSYKSALFLMIDYYYFEGTRFYIQGIITKRLYNLLKDKFPNLTEEVDKHKANILFITEDPFKNTHKGKEKKVVKLYPLGKLENLKRNNDFDLIIFRERNTNCGIILFYNELAEKIEKFRRHTGFISSSRKIAKLKDPTLNQSNNKNDIKKKLKSSLSKLEKLQPNNCFLYPSGMAAVFSSIHAVLSEKNSKIISLGNLYVDTLKILEKWPEKYNLSNSAQILDDYTTNLKNEIDSNTSAIIFEIPSNPLLEVIDVQKIISIAKRNNIKVIVDNTIATPYNFNPFDYDADIVVHSTTKFLNGKNNHIGGVLFTKNKKLMKKIGSFKEHIRLSLHRSEMRVLSENLGGFESRMEKINKNAINVARFLQNHKAVQQVHYPGLKENSSYEMMKKYMKGGSGLISFTLKPSNNHSATTFYNNVNLPIKKGPSLGSEETLMCPYVIFAHYKDSKKKLKRLGLDFYLMRLSVGIEPVKEIISSLRNALNLLL